MVMHNMTWGESGPDMTTPKSGQLRKRENTLNMDYQSTYDDSTS